MNVLGPALDLAQAPCGDATSLGASLVTQSFTSPQKFIAGNRTLSVPEERAREEFQILGYHFDSDGHVLRANRQRLTSSQLAFLEGSYQRNNDWSNQDRLRIAAILRLSRTKIYKWYWNRKQKDITRH